MQIVDEVFTRFGIRVAIKINNRKLLTGIAEVLGAADKIIDITVAIDKLDKIGLDKVNEELKAAGLSAAQVETLQPHHFSLWLKYRENRYHAPSVSCERSGLEGLR